MGVNTVFGILGMGISRIGLRANPVIAIIYSGVDSFYPGGWLGDSKNPGAFADIDRIDKENKAIVPDWNMYPKD